tara:strand:- start:947 stop:2029 length:1083 start_codon:yes stop_codon:yes gene_type:complete
MTTIQKKILLIFARLNQKSDRSDKQHNLSDRLIEPDAESQDSTINLKSDGLKFKDKEIICNAISDEWQATYPDEKEPLVNFRRSIPQAELTDSSTPTRNISGYGLTRKPNKIANIGKVIVVASGKGGVGKSTIAANMAVSLGQLGFKTGILDADLQGPSIPSILGCPGKIDIDANGRINPKEAWNIKVVSFGNIIGRTTPFISRGPVISKSFEQLLNNTNWGKLDYLVIDLPPGTGDVQIGLMESTQIDHAIVVTTPQSIALLDAHKGLSMFEKLEIPVLGVVENMSYYHCPKCNHQEKVFGDDIKQFLQERSIPLLARVPLHSKIGDSAKTAQPIPTLESNNSLRRPFEDLASRIVNQW